MSAVELMFYSGPPAPTPEAESLLWLLRDRAKDGAVDLSQNALGAALGCKRRKAAELVAALDGAGCIRRQRSYNQDGTRGPDKLLLPVLVPDDPAVLPRLCAPDAHGLEPYLRAYVRHKHMEPAGASRLCACGAQLDSSSPSTKSKNKGTPRAKVALPDAFPGPGELAQLVERFTAAGLTVDAQAEAEGFRAHHLAHGTRFASWPAAWVTWCRNAVRFANERADRQAKRQGQRQGGAWSGVAQAAAVDDDDGW